MSTPTESPNGNGAVSPPSTSVSSRGAEEQLQPPVLPQVARVAGLNGLGNGISPGMSRTNSGESVNRIRKDTMWVPLTSKRDLR